MTIGDSIPTYDGSVATNWYWYTLILALLIPVQMGLDVLSMYIIDALFDYNVLDYLRFCQYRHRIRKEDWLLNNPTLDISLDKIYRSLDCLLFSDQYYYVVGINGWGQILAIVGFQIITANNYNMFEDPFSLMYMMVWAVIGRMGRFVCRLITTIFKIWQRPKINDVKQFNPKMNLDSYLMKEWNIYEHDAVRHSLVYNKKEWIIDNLPKFVTKDQFKEDNGFLIKVHKKLEDIIRKEEIEVVRKNLIEKNTYVIHAFIE